MASHLLGFRVRSSGHEDLTVDSERVRVPSKDSGCRAFRSRSRAGSERCVLDLGAQAEITLAIKEHHCKPKPKSQPRPTTQPQTERQLFGFGRPGKGSIPLWPKCCNHPDPVAEGLSGLGGRGGAKPNPHSQRLLRQRKRIKCR